MEEIIVKMFAILGIGSFALILGCAISGLIDWMRNKIRKIKREYKIKHRFDKPPKAACYCADCTLHQQNGECMKFDGWWTADDWFCWDATPDLYKLESEDSEK